VSWLRRLLAGLSPQRPRFDPRLVHVRLVVDEVALGQVPLSVFQFSPVSIIPSALHTHRHQHAAVSRRNGRSLGRLPSKQCSIRNREALDREAFSPLQSGQAGRSGNRIPVGARFSAPVQTGPEAHPAFYNGYRFFPGGKVGPGRYADPSPLLVPRSKIE
jgi:hypothetical protein